MPRENGILNIDILIANLIKVKKKKKQVNLLISNKREGYKQTKENGALQQTFYQ